jgi:ferredoxin-NADP reductase
MTITSPYLISRPYRIIGRRDIAHDIIEFRLAPTGTPIPAPKAGQWAYLELANPDGTPWARAAYSIANAAADVFETGIIEMAVKHAGSFTEHVFALKEGDEVHLQGPFGVFTFDQNASRSIFFAGGIGITPLRSMIHEALKRDIGGQMFLLYSCRAQDDMAYLEEFQVLDKRSDRFRFLPICTREEEGSSWGGMRGHVTSDILDREIPSFEGAICYLCGPLNFMEAMREILEAKGVPKERIRMERFG